MSHFIVHSYAFYCGWRYASLLVSRAWQTICLIYSIPLSLQDKTEPYFFKAAPIKEDVVKHMSVSHSLNI